VTGGKHTWGRRPNPLDDPGITVLRERADRVRALRHPDLASNPCGEEEPANLLFMNGSGHRRVRAVVRDAVAAVDPLPVGVGDTIREVVGRLSELRSFDLVADFARPVSAHVTTALLGVEEPLDDAFLDDLEATSANLDVWFGVPADHAGRQALRIAMFFLRATARPGGGLAVLRAAHTAGRLTDDELTLTPVMLAHAAYENSLNFLACAGLQLVGNPGLATALAESGPEASRFIRELAGRICPARFVMRRALDTVTLASGTVSSGSNVAIFLGPDADGAHPFGMGNHSCPGATLALAEAEVALTALAPALPGSTVTEVRWKDHPAFFGLSSANVTRHNQPFSR
jgi:cytochrome P450